MNFDKSLQSLEGFEWDSGNIEKNWVNHKVAPHECEEVFFNQPLIVSQDIKHSAVEQRFYALGRTERDRHLFLAFTIRKKRIRVISARDMNRKQKRGKYMARKVIPIFKSEQEEIDFWASHDSSDFIDWSKGRVGVFPNLKPSLKTISIRLPEGLIEALKSLANKKDVPYQSLMKVYLGERVEAELDKDNSLQRSRKARRRA